MGFSDAIKTLQNLNDADVLQQSLEQLIMDQRDEIIQERMKSGRLIGFLNELRFKNSRRKEVIRCNARILAVKAKTVDVRVVAPMRMADKELRVPKEWILEPFEIHEGMSHTEDQNVPQVEF